MVKTIEYIYLEAAQLAELTCSLNKSHCISLFKTLSM